MDKKSVGLPLRLSHKKSKGTGGHRFSPGIGDDSLNNRQLAAQLFGRGLAEQVALGRAEELHGSVGRDAAKPGGTGAAAAHRIRQSRHGPAVNHAVGVN